MDLLLLHPPAAKAAEPPLGTAVLLGHLRQAGFSAAALDANLEAYLYLLEPQRLLQAAGPGPTAALCRAIKHVPRSLMLLRSAAAADSFPRYSAAVHHLNQALSAHGGSSERLTLGDYSHAGLSEFAPEDLETISAGAATTLFSGYFQQRLLPQVVALRPKLVALSVNYRHQILPAFELAGLLRRALPGLTIVGGGGMFSSWRSELRSRQLSFSAFDHIVFGPGEAPLAALAAGTAAADYCLEEAGTLAFRPDYSFAALGEYFSPRPVLQLSASRGCYWRRCQFCPEAATPTHPYASLIPAELPQLLRVLGRAHGVEHFHLTDNALPVPVLRALATPSAEGPPPSWHGFVRFERALLDGALVAGLAAGGCRLLQLGLESGSQALLDRIGKGTRLDEVARILANLQRAGIASYVYVMLGVPGESEADAEQTLAFLEEHAAAIGYLNLAIMNLPRESELLETPEKAGIATLTPGSERESLGLYRGFTAENGWGRREARRFLQRRLLASPAIRAIVQRTPPLFTSNHAFLFASRAG